MLVKFGENGCLWTYSITVNLGFFYFSLSERTLDFACVSFYPGSHFRPSFYKDVCTCLF